MLPSLSDDGILFASTGGTTSVLQDVVVYFLLQSSIFLTYDFVLSILPSSKFIIITFLRPAAQHDDFNTYVFKG
jgi:hypothetical protein